MRLFNRKAELRAYAPSRYFEKYCEIAAKSIIGSTTKTTNTERLMSPFDELDLDITKLGLNIDVEVVVQPERFNHYRELIEFLRYRLEEVRGKLSRLEEVA